MNSVVECCAVYKFDDLYHIITLAVHQWKKDDVGVWLKQMSPTLHAHYSALFAKHDVTGRITNHYDSVEIMALKTSNAAVSKSINFWLL